MSKKSSEYILGTSDEELERLGFQHQIWLEEAVELWKRADFNLGNKLLDVGCGPGFATVDLARLVGSNGSITAIDVSEKFIDYLQRQIDSSELSNVSAQISDVHALDLPENGFDGAFARWLLCFVAEPERVVAEVSRVLKTGGKFVVIDYFNYLAVKVYPRRESIEKLFAAYYESVRLAGGNYDIGGQLPEIMTRNGFEVLTIKPINRIAAANSRFWYWVETFHKSYVPRLVQSELLSESEAADFWRDWNDLKNEQTAFFSTPPMLGIIAVKK